MTRLFSYKSKTESKAEATETKKLKYIFDHARVGIAMCNAQNNKLELVNPEFARMHGYSIDELIGVAPDDVFAPECMKQVAEHEDALDCSEGDIAFETMHLRKDGSSFDVFTNITVVRDNSGKILHRIANIQDITEQKNRHVILDEGKKRHEQIINNIGDPAYLIEVTPDKRFMHLEINKAFVDALGAPKEVLLGKYVDELENAEFAEILDRKYRSCLEAGMRVNFVGEYNLPAGKLTYHSVLTPIMDEDGQIVRIAGIARDVTEEKALSISLEKATEEAQSASRAKSEFLANMSHEIRTPLNAIVGMSHLLLGSKLDDQSNHYAQNIISASSTLLSLINDILDFSKIEAGKMIVEKGAFSFTKMIMDLSEIFRARAEQKLVTFDVSIDNMMPQVVLGDELKLKQVLMNLISNALKFTHHGYVKVTIKVKSFSGSKIIVEVGVRDTGIGMNDEQQKGLFSEFYQADQTSTKRYGGTGLGLAICKKILRMVGGDISVQSELGRGSYFCATIPLDIADNVQIEMIATQAPRLDSKTLSEMQGFMNGKTVMIVDDNSINREMLKFTLERFGADTFEAISGADAINKLLYSSQKCDAVMMDIQMPGMDGFEASSYIRAAGFASLPIIALSADVTPASKQKAAKCGIVEYLTKPISPDHLAICLAKHMRIPLVGSEEDKKQDATKYDNAFPPLDSIDTATGLRGFFDDNAKYKQFLEKFALMLKETRIQMAECIETHDMYAIGALAHTLKGVARNVGASMIAQVCSQLQNNITQEQFVMAIDSIGHLDREIEQFEADMKTVCLLRFKE